ncbi:MAG TPA: hypothetical protein EYQ25_02770 [Planctomycetes bacterium]|nr:hypothetical protein [Planctomycetota bacterium]HIL36307.1 hypothetical protein [Planctomycetota bacterium]
MSNPEEFAAALDAAEQSIDWKSLENIYCSDGGAGFFSEEAINATRTAGLLFASDLGEHLSPRGRSMYVGAGVAELAPLVFEATMLSRRVTVHGLPGLELEQLKGAMQAVSEVTQIDTPRVTSDPIRPAETGQVDHLWFVSVLTDPEAFPALHNRLYDRQGGPLQVSGGHPKAERARADTLVRLALGSLTTKAILTTSDEELPIFEAIGTDMGLRIVSPTVSRLTGIVGDPVRHHRVINDRTQK